MSEAFTQPDDDAVVVARWGGIKATAGDIANDARRLSGLADSLETLMLDAYADHAEIGLPEEVERADLSMLIRALDHVDDWIGATTDTSRSLRKYLTGDEEMLVR